MRYIKLLSSVLMIVTVFMPFISSYGQESKNYSDNNKAIYIEQVASKTAEETTISFNTESDSVSSLNDELKITTDNVYLPYHNLGSHLSTLIKTGQWDDIDVHHFRHHYFFFYHVFSHQHLHANRIVSFKN